MYVRVNVCVFTPTSRSRASPRRRLRCVSQRVLGLHAKWRGRIDTGRHATSSDGATGLHAANIIACANSEAWSLVTDTPGDEVGVISLLSAEDSKGDAATDGATSVGGATSVAGAA